jgi:hypothetical protein
VSPASTYLLSIAATTHLLWLESISLNKKHESIAVWIAASDSGVLDARGGRGVVGERGRAGGGAGSERGGGTEAEEEEEEEEEGGGGAKAFDALSAEIAARGAEEGLRREGAATAAGASSSCFCSFAASAVARRASALIWREGRKRVAGRF